MAVDAAVVAGSAVVSVAAGAAVVAVAPPTGELAWAVSNTVGGAVSAAVGLGEVQAARKRERERKRER